jgi:hypothetical protein
MNNKQSYTVGTIPKWNIVKRGKIGILTHKYMTAHLPDLVQAFE